ncbi:two component transcriptional regulator, LuxR family [Geodermatophilus aquaeductus]|jgi:DNA-binding NarL/FixJ family response regulator|uniref:Two component transcriptional regulator, LuxR family n=1 Tax=Geodermatophilus aquaeductus TaxID=1564161 RepID=A0A521F8F1_9ACTN|nr:response regulator transcription factor [Geodermatophilus aquaeductus]SMO92495.1 two component transcriptional regulator, LuxR family [Geodermatophilus aquaeductus]
MSPGDRPLRVVLGEDSVLLREGLVRLLEEAGTTVAAAVGDGPSLVRAVLAERPDVAVVDVRMPPTHTDEGLRAAVEVRRVVPGTAVLVLSQYVEVAYADELLADGRGGVGYLLKDRVTDLDQLLAALGEVVAGGTVLDPQVVAQLFARRRADDPVRRLTPREREVLGLIAEGHSNTAIARQLVVTPGAVEKHTQRIFAKLGLAPDEERNSRVMATLAYLRG